MKRSRFSMGLLIGLFVLVGCGQQPTDQSLPTLNSTANSELTTATTAATDAATQPPLERPTLPPTWTVSPVATEPPTATVDLTRQAQLVKPTLVVCGGFAADRERSGAVHDDGNPVQVFWTVVDTAARYRISLRNDSGVELITDYTLEPTYTFAGDIFERDGVYAWSVYPEDSLNQQMCFERGAEILPQ
jgi:hypothetical protein